MQIPNDTTLNHATFSVIKEEVARGVGYRTFNKHTVGLVTSGKLIVQDGEKESEAGTGDLVFIAAGNHYVEYMPQGGRPFEMISVFFTSEEFRSALGVFHHVLGIGIPNDVSVPRYVNPRSYSTAKSWEAISGCFHSIIDYLEDDVLCKDTAAHKIKKAELVYMIITKPGCILKQNILINSNDDKRGFEKLIRDNIFKNIPIEKLAEMSGMSLTSFKKEFRDVFNVSPHKWFVKQRLMRARLSLISSDRPISEIGRECNFPNTSHFIKLFRREYGITPANYRKKYRSPQEIKTPKRFQEA